MDPGKGFAFIWDMDGTLVDSYPAIIPLVKSFCEEFGADYSDDFIYSYIMSSSVGNMIDELAEKTGQDPAPFKERFNRLNDNHIDSVKASLHADETLSALTKYGCHFIYTHRGASCRAILENTGLSGYFTEIVTALDGFPRKPAPDAVLYLIHRYNLDPGKCFYIGDRPMDVQTAANAGIRSILYMTGSNPVKQESYGKADYIVGDLLDIEGIIIFLQNEAVILSDNTG